MKNNKNSLNGTWLYCKPHVKWENSSGEPQKYTNAKKLENTAFEIDIDFFDDEKKALNHAKSMYTIYSNEQVEPTGSLASVYNNKKRKSDITAENNNKQKVMKQLREDSLVERERRAENMKKKQLTKENMAKENMAKGNIKKKSPSVSVNTKTVVKRQALAELPATTNRSSNSNSSNRNRLTNSNNKSSVSSNSRVISSSNSNKGIHIQQLPVSIRNTVPPSPFEPSFVLYHAYTLADVKERSDQCTISAVEKQLESLETIKGLKGSTSTYMTKWKEIPENRRIIFTLPMGFIFGTISISRETNTLEGEVHCIYIDKNHRGMKYSPLLYQKFEELVIKTATMMNSKAFIAVGLRSCIQESAKFWEKMGFPSTLSRGDDVSIIKWLIK